MSWRLVAFLIGVIGVGGIGWSLTPYLQSLWVIQQTGSDPQVIATGWGILRTPALWPLIVVGLLMGWFAGRLEGLWTGSQAAESDLRVAREAMEAEADTQTRWVTQERQNLERAWSEVSEARQTAQQAIENAEAERAQIAATQQSWERWAKQEVEQAKAETAEAKKRSRNAIGTAERRKRKLERVISERSHTA